MSKKKEVGLFYLAALISSSEPIIIIALRPSMCFIITLLLWLCISTYL